LILSSSSIHLAPPHLDPCCVGGRSRGRRKQWRAAARGRGRGSQRWGKGGVGGQEKGKGRGRPLGFCGRKKRRLRCLLTLHPTGHNSFPHPRNEDQLLVNIFLGYYNMPSTCLPKSDLPFRSGHLFEDGMLSFVLHGSQVIPAISPKIMPQMVLLCPILYSLVFHANELSGQCRFPHTSPSCGWCVLARNELTWSICPQ
jgi:hypothetical protein